MELNKQSKKITKKKVVKKPVSYIDGVKKWTTLQHIGLVFPPPYTPHGVGIRYDGVPVTLTPDQEEVATLYAELLDTDYVKEKLFNDNFFRDWKKLLGGDHVIKKLENCDFGPIYEWVLMEKEKKKAMTPHERAALNEERQKELKKYMPSVDGVKQWADNIRVSPPSLFMGRGKHPKMGTFRRRIYPSDVIINIGKDSPIPESPIPGHSWKEVRHDNSVSWMACWKNPIIPNEFTYTFWTDHSRFRNHSVVQKPKVSSTLKNWFGKGNMLTRLISFALSNLSINRIALNHPNEDNNRKCNQANMYNAPTTVTSESCNGQTSMEEAALDFASLKIFDWEIIKEEDLQE